MNQRQKILLAGGDDPTARALTETLLERGFELVQARDAVSATAAVLRNRPDAVVLFGQLPGGGAVLVLRRIRASVHSAMTPVLAIIGRREGDESELRSHGVDNCLQPPADPAAIATWIEKRLSRPTELVAAPLSIIRGSDRMAALNRTALLDSPPHESFDALTGLASKLLGVPVALVSLVDNDRQFFKSQVGLPEPWATARETPLTHSFCQWVVSSHEPLIVSNSREHPVLSKNLALHGLGVVAYAGVPLTATTGEPIGALCAIDGKPRSWSDDNVELLKDLAVVAEACIAVGEVAMPQQLVGLGVEAERISRSLLMRSVGAGISAATELIQRDDPNIGAPERKALLKLLEWFGSHIARLAAA